jgi:osmotically-inducible protein OsmY
MFQFTDEMKTKVRGDFDQVKASLKNLQPRDVVDPSGPRKLHALLAVLEGTAVYMAAARKSVGARDSDSKVLVTTLERMHNATSGVIDQIAAMDASSKDLEDLQQELQSGMQAFRTQVKAMKSKAEAGASALGVSAAELATMSPAEREWRMREAKDNAPIREDEDIKEILKVYNRWHIKMPHQDADAMGDRQMIMLDLPVIPILPFAVKPERLKNMGIRATEVGKYLIFENQRIMGVNPKAVPQRELDDFVDETLKIFSAKTNTRWTLVSEQTQGYRGLGLLFYWIMEDRKLNQLIPMLHASIDEWGFPFLFEPRKFKKWKGPPKPAA